MDKQLRQKLRVVREKLTRWQKPMGLLWWRITVHYYDDPVQVLRIFGGVEGDRIVPAITTADWVYGIATVSVNMLAVAKMDDTEIEAMVVHELCHILVNEMRENEIHHEEQIGRAHV